MAINKKPVPKPPLSMVEIVMRADVATIQAALEARQKVDALLAERAAAYERIAALERQIDEVVGEPGIFVFPPPPQTVAQFTAEPAAPAPKSAPMPAESSKPAPAVAPEAVPPAEEAPVKNSGHAGEVPTRKGPKN
ncbi:MAG: hypothetical protein J6Y80_01280 [Victivallales bacterium]|nr:hypothetical protein [Victivallales bacterium]